MSILIVVIVLLTLAIWAIQKTPIPSPLNWILQVVAIIIVILDRAGGTVLGGGGGGGGGGGRVRAQSFPKATPRQPQPPAWAALISGPLISLVLKLYS